MRISDWSSDVCSSDLFAKALLEVPGERDRPFDQCGDFVEQIVGDARMAPERRRLFFELMADLGLAQRDAGPDMRVAQPVDIRVRRRQRDRCRSEEHPAAHLPLMRISEPVFGYT